MAAFGRVTFGGSVFWWSVKIKISLWFGAGAGSLGLLIPVLPLVATCLGVQACTLSHMDRGERGGGKERECLMRA